MGPADRVIDAITATGIAFEIVDCDPALADTAQFCDHYGFSLQQSANAIVVVGKTEPRQFACCLALATTRLNVNTTIRRRFAAKKASFASADETQSLTGMTIGGVTPFGLDRSLPIWIDAAVMEVPQIIVGGGSRDRKLLVPPTALTALPNAAVVDDLASPVTT